MFLILQTGTCRGNVIQCGEEEKSVIERDKDRESHKRIGKRNEWVRKERYRQRKE
jgi:ATPase subunit of ABC transporter with duplicated ATPase domains